MHKDFQLLFFDHTKGSYTSRKQFLLAFITYRSKFVQLSFQGDPLLAPLSSGVSPSRQLSAERFSLSSSLA